MGTIFGFDLGTASVGAAVVETDGNGHPHRLSWLSTRAFEETRAGRKLETKNKERRQARLMRRQTRRRKWRNIALGRTLAEAEMLPPFGTPEWDRLMLSDPYGLRARALSEPLSPMELGRALYHLAQRRGFRFPTPEEEADESKDAEERKDEGVVKEGIATLRAKMGNRTVGAYLAGQPRKRGKEIHLGRDMVEAEFDAIWEVQARLNPTGLSAELRERLRRVIFFQRPTFWRIKTLGVCSLLPGQSLCLKGSWEGQQFVMLKELNNLSLVAPEVRPLTSEERQAALGLMEAKATVTFGAIRKAAGLRGAEFNYERGKAKAMHGNATEAALRKALGSAWDALPTKGRIRAEIGDRLWQVNYRRVGNKRVEIRGEVERRAERMRFVREAQADFGLTEAQAAALAEIHLPVGWLRYSEAAIRRLLPHLDQSRGEYEAVAAEFPQRGAAIAGIGDRLPSHPAELPEIRNPTVVRTLNELRKVTNNLVRKFGKPERIRIELARELKQPAAIRLKQHRENQRREDDRKRALAALRERGRPETGLNIEKWLLWQECGETSPYTGDKIGFEALFDRGEFQVDHIWPQARSFDNTQGNKVLCESEINRDKGTRTPFEYFRDTGRDWKEFKRRVQVLKLPPGKVRRLLNPNLEAALSDELAERQLRDTSYAAVAARRFLERLGVPVDTSSGRVTSEVARRWGLYGAAFGRNRKDRSDLRHHAVDALAVALASPAVVKRLSDFHARAQLGRPPEFHPPWAGLWQETRDWAERMVVSHKVQRKVSGPLHAENAWRHIGPDPEDPVYARYGVRKPVEGIGPRDLEDIPDPVVRDYARQAREGATPGALPFPQPQRTRLHQRKRPEVVVPIRAERNVYADKGDNHHMGIYGRNGQVEDYDPVSLFQAAERLAKGRPVVSPWLVTGTGERLPLICSLARGDLLELEPADERPRYALVKGIWDNGQVELASHTAAQRDIWSRPNYKSIFGSLGGRKIAVDPIGRVRPSK